MINSNKAIFFDRDGVINDNSLYYTYKIADVVFNDGIFEAMKLFQDNGLFDFCDYQSKWNCKGCIFS